MILTHPHLERLGPLTVALAELAVLEPVGLLALVLMPQEHQRDVFTPELGVHPGPVRQRSRRRQRLRIAEESFLERGVVPVFANRPTDAGLLRSPQVLDDGGRSDIETAGNLTPGNPQALES